MELVFLDNDPSHAPSDSRYHTKIRIKPQSSYLKSKKHSASLESDLHFFIEGRGVHSIVFDGNRRIDLSDPANESLKNLNEIMPPLWEDRGFDPRLCTLTLTEEHYNRSVPIQ